MRGLLAFSVLSLALLSPRIAEARASDQYAYRYEHVWAATVRMIRVDLRCPIEDRDQDLGFVLFDYVDRGRHYPGSAELVRTEVRGVSVVRVTVQISAMPTYISRMLLDRLQRKLLEDYGEPLRPIRPEEPSDDDDDGEEDEEDTVRDPRSASSGTEFGLSGNSSSQEDAATEDHRAQPRAPRATTPRRQEDRGLRDVRLPGEPPSRRRRTR